MKVLPPEKGYNLEISYQIKKEVCFDINQHVWTTMYSLVIYSMFV